jgi:hypothetical protein
MDYMTLSKIVEQLEAILLLPGVHQETALESLTDELIAERDYIEMEMARQMEFELDN